MVSRKSSPRRKKPTRVRSNLKNDRLPRMQRLAIHGELAATAVHEISNLQTIVLFNAGLLRERHRDDPEILRYIEPLLHAGTMIASMCNQLRVLAHPAEAQAQLTDLAEVAQGTYRLLEQIIGRRVSFVRPPKGPLLVLADSGHLEQMLINLVLNSRDATTAETGRIAIRVGRNPRGGGPWLEVEDNGTGMTPAVKAKLFTKYFTTKEPGRGTGLGLVTVRRLLEAMGGHISLHSRAGRGTRIRLTFPTPPPALVAEYLAATPPSPDHDEPPVS
jgi:signal transduction histidine kinase